MVKINLLCCYFVHGLDGCNKDFKNIHEKTKEIFNSLFKNGNENENENENGSEDEIKNYFYGYRSNDNALLKTHAQFQTIIDKSFNELQRFMEDIALTNFQKDNEEKYNHFENIECNLYFSIIGHSLGGLISRSVVKYIYSGFKKDDFEYATYFEYLKKKFPFITTIKPCTFLTLSTPHLGSLACNENGSIVKRTEKNMVRFYCNYFSGSIGKVFTYNDGNKDVKPTLIRLSQKGYMDIYEKFPNRTLIGCVRYDIPVKFCSAIASLDHPVFEYEKENLLIDKSKSDTRICSYSGYEGKELDYYQKEIFNEKVSENMYYKDTKNVPPPNIDEQIKIGLEKINSKKKDNKDNDENQTPLKYEEMEDVFIPDTINQVESAVSVLKLFNKVSFRRIIIDFSLPNVAKLATHAIYMGNVITPGNIPVINSMVAKTVKLFSDIIIADYLLTSEQNNKYSLNDIITKNENNENAESNKNNE